MLWQQFIRFLLIIFVLTSCIQPVKSKKELTDDLDGAPEKAIPAAVNPEGSKEERMNYPSVDFWPETIELTQKADRDKIKSLWLQNIAQTPEQGLIIIGAIGLQQYDVRPRLLDKEMPAFPAAKVEKNTRGNFLTYLQPNTFSSRFLKTMSGDRSDDQGLMSSVPALVLEGDRFTIAGTFGNTWSSQPLHKEAYIAPTLFGLTSRNQFLWSNMGVAYKGEFSYEGLSQKEISLAASSDSVSVNNRIEPQEMLKDDQGHTYICGHYHASDKIKIADQAFYHVTSTPDFSSAAYIMKLDQDEKILWVKTFNQEGTSDNQFCKGLEYDADQNLIALIQFATHFKTSDELYQPNLTSSHLAMVQLSSKEGSILNKFIVKAEDDIEEAFFKRLYDDKIALFAQSKGDLSLQDGSKVYENSDNQLKSIFLLVDFHQKSTLWSKVIGDNSIIKTVFLKGSRKDRFGFAVLTKDNFEITDEKSVAIENDTPTLIMASFDDGGNFVKSTVYHYEDTIIDLPVEKPLSLITTTGEMIVPIKTNEQVLIYSSP